MLGFDPIVECKRLPPYNLIGFVALARNQDRIAPGGSHDPQFNGFSAVRFHHVAFVLEAAFEIFGTVGMQGGCGNALQDLRDDFNSYILSNKDDPGLRTLLTTFITFVVEWDFRNEHFDYGVGKGTSEPFFLHLAHYAPHRPIGAPEDRIKPYLDAGLSRKTATVYAMI